MKIICFILLTLLLPNTRAFYLRKYTGSLKVGVKSSDSGSKIEALTKSSDGFPKSFKFTADILQQPYVFNRRDESQYITAQNSYTLGQNGKLESIDQTNDIKHEFYVSEDGLSVATLIDNSDLNNHEISVTDKQRYIITIAKDEKRFDFVPVVISPPPTQTKALFRKTLIHSVDVNKVDVNYHADFLKAPNSKPPENSFHSRKKRAVNGQPVTLNVEVLVVTDYSILVKQRNLLGTTNDQLCYQHMKIYYAHLFANVDQRYVNSLSSDPDLRIRIFVTNFLFLNNLADSNWTNPTYVGDSNYPTYNSTYGVRPVVLTTPTLIAFGNYINRLSLPFSFDHAIGIFDKDLWATSNSSLPSSRTGVVGVAWVGNICVKNYKFSIVEDIGFASILVAAHEIGHNLGSYHDGDSTYAPTCNASLNYIMTPSTGTYNQNYQNFNLFSSCSISMFKSTLLSGNGPVSSVAQCLNNIPTIVAEATYFNNSLMGQMWSADDQCKMKHGTNSSYCPIRNLTDICFELWCFLSATKCSATYGFGAAKGTPCGTGLVCNQGQCLSADGVTLTPNFASNPCSPNPCQNAGTCTKTELFYICQCPNGFTGVDCEIQTTLAPTTTGLSSTTASGIPVSAGTTTTTTSGITVSAGTTTTTASAVTTASGVTTTSILIQAATRNSASKIKDFSILNIIIIMFGPLINSL